MEQALEGDQNCIADGIKVKGYCYWSLLDNFEWQKGYSMTFGLIAVDRSSQKRIPKESFYIAWCRQSRLRTGLMQVHMMKPVILYLISWARFEKIQRQERLSIS